MILCFFSYTYLYYSYVFFEATFTSRGPILQVPGVFGVQGSVVQSYGASDPFEVASGKGSRFSSWKNPY